MKRLKSYYLLLIAAFFLVSIYACQSGSQEEFSVGPSSELTLLMREMYDNGAKVKKQILEESAELDLKEFQAIHTAKPTKNNLRSPAFEALGSSYQQTVMELKNVPKTQRVEHHNLMVDACMQCHATYCPGPMVKIKKLYLPALSQKEK